jgi:hypothetical protein
MNRPRQLAIGRNPHFRPTRPECQRGGSVRRGHSSCPDAGGSTYPLKKPGTPSTPPRRRAGSSAGRATTSTGTSGRSSPSTPTTAASRGSLGRGNGSRSALRSSTCSGDGTLPAGNRRGTLAEVAALASDIATAAQVSCGQGGMNAFATIERRCRPLWHRLSGGLSSHRRVADPLTRAVRTCDGIAVGARWLRVAGAPV